MSRAQRIEALQRFAAAAAAIIAINDAVGAVAGAAAASVALVVPDAAATAAVSDVPAAAEVVRAAAATAGGVTPSTVLSYSFSSEASTRANVPAAKAAAQTEPARLLICHFNAAIGQLEARGRAALVTALLPLIRCVSSSSSSGGGGNTSARSGSKKGGRGAAAAAESISMAPSLHVHLYSSAGVEAASTAALATAMGGPNAWQQQQRQRLHFCPGSASRLHALCSAARKAVCCDSSGGGGGDSGDAALVRIARSAGLEGSDAAGAITSTKGKAEAQRAAAARAKVC